MAKLEELSTEAFLKKRLFWKRVFWAGIGFFALIVFVTWYKYRSTLGVAEKSASRLPDYAAEIALHGERRRVMLDSLIWFIPWGIVASLWINVARYRLRKLKKLGQNMSV